MIKYICYNWMGMVADHCLDFSRADYKSWGVEPLHSKGPFKPENVKDGDVVFVKTDYVFNGAFQQIAKKITNPYTLITGASSYKVSDGQSIRSLLDDKNLKKWYCTNAPTHINQKFVPLPIGFEEKERPGGDQLVLDRLRKGRTKFEDKINKILLPYHDLSTNPQRNALCAMLRRMPFVEVQEEKLPFEEYVKNIDRYKFVICLEGSGPDVHRNYEALLVDTVPINSRNIIEDLFKEYTLPGEFVDTWDDLDDNYFQNMSEKDYNVEGNGQFLRVGFHTLNIKENRNEN